MKKYLWLIIIAVVIVALIVVITVFSDSEEDYIVESSIKEINNKIKDDDTFILYIKQTGCEHCKEFTPKFVRVLRDYNLKAYALNIAEFNEKEKALYEDNFDIDGTPTVLFIQDGEESLITIEGDVPRETIISKLEATDFIQEK